MDNSTNGGKRPRKREEEGESSQTPDIEVKKQKNRDAARKCRQNKQQEMENLKKNNESLQALNADLMKKKADLEVKVKDLLCFIREHLDRGCELPPQEAKVWDETWRGLSQMINPTLFSATPETTRRYAQVVVPPSPQANSPAPNISSDRSAQVVRTATPSMSSYGKGQGSASPMTLFSGQPIGPGQVHSRSRRSPSQPSPAQSPSLSTASSTPPYRAMESPHSPAVTAETSPFQTSAPAASTRFSTTSYEDISYPASYADNSPHFESQVSTDSSGTIPLVVLEEEGMDESDERLGRTSTDTSEVLRQVREQPEMEVENGFTAYESTFQTQRPTTAGNRHSSMESTNLGSGGFSFRQASPYAESPQIVPRQENIPPSPESVSDDRVPEQVEIKTEEVTPNFNVTAPELIAQAVLHFQDGEISSALKKQIHSSLTTSTTVLSSKSDSSITYTNTNTAMNVNPNLLPSCISQPMERENSIPQYSGAEVPTQITQNAPQRIEQQVASPPVQTQIGATANSCVTLQVVSPTGDLVNHTFTNMKYVQKRGHHFVLDQLPNGKYKVYEVRDNFLVDTEHELQLKDSPKTPEVSAPGAII